MTLPTFLIIGAAKAGTTLLYDQLALHPEVFMPEIKEPRFFSYKGFGSDFKNPVKTLEAYEALFARVTTETAIGEASPQYLYSPIAPQRIRDTLPEVQLIVSLRHPADRVFSGYQLNLRNSGRNEGVPFREAFRTDPVLRRGYHEDLARYLALFRREQLHVVLFDDLVARGPETLAEVHRVIGVTPRPPEAAPAVSNPGGLPRNRRLHALLQSPQLRLFGRRFAPKAVMDAGRALRSRNLEKQRFDPADRAMVTEHFREDVLRTQELIGRDLSAWLPEALGRERHAAQGVGAAAG
jgi:hypothetical protein